MIRLILALCFFNILISWGGAQVNIEQYRTQAVSTQKTHFNTLNANLSYHSGNINALRFGINLKSLIQVTPFSILLIAQLDQAKSNHIDYINKQFYHVRGVYPVRQPMDIEVFIQSENNVFLQVTQRALIGTGLRFNTSTPLNDLTLYVGAGAMSESIRYTNQSTLNKSRLNLYISSQYDHRQIAINWVTYYQPNLQLFSDYQILSDFRVKAQITSLLSSITDIHYRYDATPINGLNPTDIEIKNGLGIDF